jgi:hypothetical protein
MPSIARQIDHVGENWGEVRKPTSHSTKRGIIFFENNQKDDLIGVQFWLRLPVSDPILGIYERAVSTVIKNTV